MKGNPLLTLAFFAFAVFGSPAAAAQDQPAVAKDSVQLTAFTFNVHKGNHDMWSWAPQIEFRVNGPIPSGGQLYAEFAQPGGTARWVKFDGATVEPQAGRWWRTTCGGRDVPEDKGSTATGPVNFAIKLRNELAGSDATLFKGRAKVAKVHSNEHGPRAANRWVYFVDHDWNLPIGYVYLTPDDLKGWERPILNVSFWVRGDAYNFKPHLFHQGKEVGKMFYQGEEVGKASCESELDNNTTHYVNETEAPQKAKWARVRCTFGNVRGHDRTGEEPGMFGALYQLDKNPGEYEVKVLWNNKLARSVKFTVAPGGKFDNGIASANKLGSDRVIVPVQIVGDQDGAWDKAAWKTEAFYGNPLTGFTPAP